MDHQKIHISLHTVSLLFTSLMIGGIVNQGISGNGSAPVSKRSVFDNSERGKPASRLSTTTNTVKPPASFSFENASVPNLPDPWFVEKEESGAIVETTTNTSSEGAIACHTKGGDSLNTGEAAITVNFTNVKEIIFDVKLLSTNLYSGEIRLCYDDRANMLYRLDNKDWTTWHKDIHVSINITGIHTLILHTRGDENEAIWDNIRILKEEEDAELTAPRTSTPPTIDGDIGDNEWSDANQYELTFANYNITDTHTCTVYFMYTDAALYVAMDNHFSDGWDNNFRIGCDGNNNQVADGTFDPQPHTDISVNYPAPSAWGGYDRYKMVYTEGGEVKKAVASDSSDLTKPSGLERASKAGSGTVFYEFKIPLSAIALSPGETMDMGLFTHTPNHGRMERYFWTQQLADAAGEPGQGKWEVMDTWGSLTLGIGEEDTEIIYEDDFESYDVGTFPSAGG